MTSNEYTEALDTAMNISWLINPETGEFIRDSRNPMAPPLSIFPCDKKGIIIRATNNNARVKIRSERMKLLRENKQLERELERKSNLYDIFFNISLYLGISFVFFILMVALTT